MLWPPTPSHCSVASLFEMESDPTADLKCDLHGPPSRRLKTKKSRSRPHRSTPLLTLCYTFAALKVSRDYCVIFLLSTINRLTTLPNRNVCLTTMTWVQTRRFLQRGADATVLVVRLDRSPGIFISWRKGFRPSVCMTTFPSHEWPYSVWEIRFSAVPWMSIGSSTMNTGTIVILLGHQVGNLCKRNS